MNRLSIALCFSMSLVAVGIAGFALVEIRSRGTESPVMPVQDLHETRSLLASLKQRVGELEIRHVRLERLAGSFDTPTRRSEVPASGETADLREQVEALTRRLATLEDDETIARLAQSGQVQVTEKELRNALDLVGDPAVSPDARLEALKSLRRLGKTRGSQYKNAMGESGLKERDIVLPMLELAQDTTLNPDFRAEVVRSLVGSKVEELRQPLLDLLTFDLIPEVREGAVDALIYHLADSGAQEAITRAAREDPHEAVRARAQRYLGKVEYFVRRTAEAEGAAPAEREEK